MWETIAGILEVFLNVLELIAILISIFTFFFLMFNKFNRALKVILSPLGLGFFSRIRILFICRKSAIVKRAFLEFSILKSQGYGMTSAEWRTIINEFKTFLNSSNGEYVYAIPNCTILIGEDFAIAVGRYFEYLGKRDVKKAFGIQDDGLKWVIKLRVEEVYATPTCLLTGLLSMYEENWEEFIKRYVSTAYITESEEDRSISILPEELYLTFAWLLWGPSYEINYKTNWEGLCQLSYGDESNSVPAFINKQTSAYEQLLSKLEENEGRRYGALLSAEISLYEKKYFYGKIREYASPDNLYFIDKIEGSGLTFATQLDSFTPYTNYKSKKYYCTAYVWILFEVEEDGYYFKPEKSLAFFEHANITDNKTYNFLIETLIDKSMTHFKKVFGDESLNGRKYRFVCALNKQIEEACVKRYAEAAAEKSEFGKSLSERVIMKAKRSPISAFAAYDNFFKRNHNMTFVDIDYNDKHAVTDLGVFYTEIYMESFPDPNERELFDNLLLYLKRGHDSPEYEFHIVLAKDENGRIVGGCIFDYYNASNAGVIEFLAIRKDLQSSGIGTALYKYVLGVLEKDAYIARKETYSSIFCEIDSPEYSKANVKKYLYFWHKNGYKHLDFKYVQPALSQNQQPVYGLWFNVMPHNLQGNIVTGDYVLSVIADYMKYSMQIADYANNPEYKKMEEELKDKPSVNLLNIL